MKFLKKKYWELAELKNDLFCESAIFILFFFQKKIFASFPWKQVKVYRLARTGQNFDQAKRDDTFWSMSNILKGSVCIFIYLFIISRGTNAQICYYVKRWQIKIFMQTLKLFLNCSSKWLDPAKFLTLIHTSFKYSKLNMDEMCGLKFYLL